MSDTRLFWEYNESNYGGISYISCPSCGFKISCRRFVTQVYPYTGGPVTFGFDQCPQCKKAISSAKLDYEKIFEDAQSQEELKINDL